MHERDALTPPAHGKRNWLIPVAVLLSPWLMFAITLTIAYVASRLGATRNGDAILIFVNTALAFIGSAAGGLRVGGTLSTRVAVAIATGLYAAESHLIACTIAVNLKPPLL